MIPQENPSWDAGMLYCFTTILFDPKDGLHKMWYSLWGAKEQSQILAYATSRDGVSWVKPSLGIIEYKGTKDNNIIREGDALETGVFIDPHETDPTRRFKMLYQGVRAAYSADGLRWTDYNQGKKVIFHPPGHDSQSVPYWDGRLGRYVAIIRDRTGMIKDVRKEMVANPWAREVYRKLWGGPKKDRVPENHSLRRVGQVESEDFVHWTRPELDLWPDLEDDAGSLGRIEKLRSQLDVPDDPNLMRTEFYGMGFHLTESCSLAFPWLFTINNNARYGNHEGPGELQLAVSCLLYTSPSPRD